MRINKKAYAGTHPFLKTIYANMSFTSGELTQ